jgi:t-SNARE complex subunit (syntaxin)
METRQPIGVGDVIRGVQERVQFVLSADRMVIELLEILRDTHRILQKFEEAFDRFDERAREAEDKIGELDLYAKRFDRLEEAVMNIERATLSVEAALHALPKTFQHRITRELRARDKK